ncbi:MAG: class II aldolase/adducin family protein [Alphaproteobacteria bacterium]|nr:class II aldolase/adducin family protein [Alphaproteobacteria bacterium]
MPARLAKPKAASARKLNISAAEWDDRVRLAACYRMFVRRQMDDLIYTHLSVRVSDQPDAFLFIGFGQLFDDVTASTLLKVDLDGNNIGSVSGEVNPAGWVVHGTVYKAKPEANSVMHLHTITGVAVSAQKSGLLPINQFAITYDGKIGYHDYDGPGLRPEEQKAFVRNLADNKMMFLRNHGTLSWGRSLAEAFTLMHYLERTCEIQIAAQGGGTLVLPPRAVIERTAKTGQGTGDARWGDIGFEALLRRLDREDPSYRA